MCYTITKFVLSPLYSPAKQNIHMNNRTLSPYEKTQLVRHGISNNQVTGSIPIEYVTGVADFCGLQLKVTPSVLIPRVETEGLVELALQCIAEKTSSTSSNANLSIIDVGTGSGAIIISIAKHLENTSLRYQLSAVDISHAAIDLAKENAARLTTVTIPFTKADLLDGNQARFDLIVANLPYIPSEAVKKLDASVINHEPILALDGGNDGFQLVKRLVIQSKTHLQPRGTIILELDTSHTEIFFDAFKKEFNIEFFRDCFDRHRFVRLDLKNTAS